LTGLPTNRIVPKLGICRLMRISLVIVLLALTIRGLASSAAAEEYCVTCTEPDAKYRCVVTGQPGIHDEHAPLRCISELAQSGGHASCSVGAVTSGPCPSNLRTVTLPSLPPPAPVTEAPPPPQAPVMVPVPAASPVPESPAAASGGPQPALPAEGPPKTVEEFAKKSGDGLKKAGEAVTDTAQSAGNAVGNAAKKTWDCLSSFFGNC
jgi:hypothetical protein